MSGGPGVTVPKAMMKRMDDVAKAAGKSKKKARLNQEEEGIKITVELIEQCREIPGVKGCHIQAIEWEHKVPEIVERAGLLPRPQVEVKEEAEATA